MTLRRIAAFCVLTLCALFTLDAQQLGSEIIPQIIRHDAAKGLTAQDLNDFRHDRTITNELGLQYHYLTQTVNGVPVHNAVMTLVTDESSEVMHFNDTYIRGIERYGAKTNPSLTPEAALSRAEAHLGVQTTNLEMIDHPHGSAQKGSFNKGGISLNDIPFSLVLEKTDEQSLTLCWEFVIYMLDTRNWWQIRVNAETGEVVSKDDWITTCRWDADPSHEHARECISGRVGRNPMITPASTAAPLSGSSYRVFPEPMRSPYDGARTLESEPWMSNPNASPFGWHDTDGSPGPEFTITRGNNVWAQEDRDGNNEPGYAPDGGAGLTFDFPLDLSQQPVTYQDAAITNLFYWNNLCHDFLYQYGFDEQSGNFQQNNYGNGGLGNDFVFADAQDGSGFNNANFGTPPDGSNPRMQMFEWTIPESPFFIANGANYNAVGAGFGPQSASVTGELVVALDGSGQPNLVCNAVTNGGAVNGKIALIDRGDCAFVVKVLNAQNAGAIAVVMVQNDGSAPFAMGGNDPAITIPSVMISQADGTTLKNQLLQGVVNVSINLPNSVNRDSDLDNEIIAHEYAHGLSIRLTAGADNVSCLFNNEQMGEGWSDYLGLIMTMTPSDAANDARGMANYSFGTGPAGVGIRPFPYSYDLSVNPVTYNDISSLSIPHGVGSVWCSMLWDMTWLLIDEHGFDADLFNGTGGNNIAFQLVVEGLKLQPCSPGFVDGRDAILLADQLLYGGANQCIIWEAFARRGLGVNADQGSSASVTDGVESYELGGPCTLFIEKVAPATLGAGNSAQITLIVTNNTGGTVSNVTVTDEIAAEVDYVAGSASCPASLAGGVLTFSLGTLQDGESMMCNYQVAAPEGNFSIYTFYDDIEGETTAFTTESGFANFEFVITQARASSPINSWYAVDPNEESDFYLILSGVEDINASTFMSFMHFYNTETNWDGCVVEYSTNGGSNWVDAGSLFTQNGYNGTINVNESSAISGRPAFTGGSSGFIESILDLSSFAGQTLDFRFRMAADFIIGGDGWYIDDIFIGEALVQFDADACVSSDQTGLICASARTMIIEDDNCLGDFNNDGIVNASDLLILLAEFGCSENCLTDLDGDGSITAGDAIFFLTLFNTICP